MVIRSFRNAGFAVALGAVALTGCSSYIKRDEFDSAMAELRATDQRLQSQIDELGRKHDALVTQMAGKVRLDVAAHFDTNDATLGEDFKPFLDDFSRVVRENHGDAVITVEGFADPAGPAALNRRLGLRRANAVRDYLIGTGMTDAQVRAISYGEDRNRQVRPGAVGEAGRDNRRVSLVVDYAGTPQQRTASM